MNKTYHIGLLKSGKSVIMQMTTNVDCLSPQTWIYYGHRITTKKRIKEQKSEILAAINLQNKTEFKYLVIQ